MIGTNGLSVDSMGSAIRQVLGNYPQSLGLDNAVCTDVPQGLSGSRVWKVVCGERSFCLRRWPPQHPNVDRLTFIHSVLDHLGARGLGFIPVVLRTELGQSFVQADGTLWELTTWLPGTASYRERPSLARLKAAVRALAALHLQARNSRSEEPPPKSAPAVVDRLQLLTRYREKDFERLVKEASSQPWPELLPRAERILSLFHEQSQRLASQLKQAASIVVPLQPCVRDIHDEHVLFVDDEVTGIIDFGAMRIDTVATDLARMFGSMTTSTNEIKDALTVYSDVAPLSADEQKLVYVLIATSPLLGCMQWLEWIYLENRHFADASVVLARIDRQLACATAVNRSGI